MPLRTYNGFNHYHRMKGGRIIEDAVRAGKVEPPSKCCRCGQTKGEILYHVEDYTPDKILDNLEPTCRRCHGYIHRVSRPAEKQNEYWDAIARGVKFPPQGKPKVWM